MYTLFSDLLPGTILKFIFSIRIYGVWSVRMSRWQVLFVTILLTITLALFWLKLFTLEWLSHQFKIRVLFSFFSSFLTFFSAWNLIIQFQNGLGKEVPTRIPAKIFPYLLYKNIENHLLHQCMFLHWDTVDQHIRQYSLHNMFHHILVHSCNEMFQIHFHICHHADRDCHDVDTRQHRIDIGRLPIPCYKCMKVRQYDNWSRIRFHRHMDLSNEVL